MNSCETIAQFLIEKGININQTNKYGYNAFHLSLKEGHKSIVQLLIEKGFDVKQIDENEGKTVVSPHTN